MALNLEEDNVGAVLLGESKEIREGDTVKRTGVIASIKAGDGLLRVALLTHLPTLSMAKVLLPATSTRCRWNAKLPV